MMIFAWLKDKVPHCSFVKAKQNDDILIICTDNLAIYYLNATAAFFIKSVDGSSTIEDIKQKFMQKYEVDSSELENDIVNMVRDLQWKQILTLE